MILCSSVEFYLVVCYHGIHMFSFVSVNAINLSINKDLLCIFRTSCYSVRLSWVLVLTWVCPFVQDKRVGFGLGEDQVILLRHSR